MNFFYFSDFGADPSHPNIGRQRQHQACEHLCVTVPYRDLGPFINIRCLWNFILHCLAMIGFVNTNFTPGLKGQFLDDIF